MTELVKPKCYLFEPNRFGWRTGTSGIEVSNKLKLFFSKSFRFDSFSQAFERQIGIFQSLPDFSNVIHDELIEIGFWLSSTE